MSMAAEKASNGCFHRTRELSLRVVEYFTPPGIAERPEEVRRARLIIGFAILGDIFGIAFAAFYAFIGHFWGAGIVFVCCITFACIPFLLRKTGSPDRAGNLYCLVLIGGFFCLCAVEGGMHGHALAWLASAPLCALLLSSRRAANWWGGLSITAALAVVGVDLAGHPMPVLYPAEWHRVISAAGYVSLVAFMFILGIIFEKGRARAQARMQQTLGELAEANGRLTRLNEEKNEFLGIAAHDLKNPLSVVMAYSELLEIAGEPGSSSVKFAATINQESRRMRDLISNLLDLNAIESGRTNLTISQVHLNAVIRRSVDNLQAVAAKKGIAIELDAKVELHAAADLNALLQVLDNLISNAVKFSKTGTRVFVELRKNNDQAVIAVADRGPGISEADRAKLFQRFTRLTARPTGGESSNGLGLSIVKRLVEAMRGAIECQSVLGEGTTFIVTLPGCREAATILPREKLAELAGA